MLVRRFCVLQVLSCTWLRTRFWQRRALLIASAAQRNKLSQSQGVKHRSPRKASRDREYPILGSARPRRVRAAVLASRPRRAESENQFNFRERAETSARESEPSPRKADSRCARLVCRPAVTDDETNESPGSPLLHILVDYQQ